MWFFNIVQYLAPNTIDIYQLYDFICYINTCELTNFVGWLLLKQEEAGAVAADDGDE